MANRNFSRFQALEKEVKALYAEISFSAGGAPSIVKALGVESVALDSGKIKITLQDKYVRLLHVSVVEKSASPSLTAPVAVVAEDVASAKSITLSNADALASTSILVRIDLQNSTAR